MKLFSRAACGDRDSGTDSRCTKPNEPKGHRDGIHVDGRRVQMRGWVDGRSVPDDLSDLS